MYSGSRRTAALICALACAVLTRVLLDKHSRTNLCDDYGVGRDGSRGFYLAIQEAF